MSFESVKFEDTDIKIIDGDRGKNYPSQNEYLEEGYCLFLNAKNVTDSGFKFNKTKFITKEKDNVLRKGKLKKGDVVLTTRGTVGNVAFYTNEIPYENIRINSGMLIFRLEGKEEFLPEYIYWYFRSNLFQSQIKQYISGSAQPQLPVKTINKMKILKPDIKVQKKIVEIISSVNKKVLNNNKMNKTLEEIAQTIYKRWFVDFEFPNENGEPYKSSGGEMVYSEEMEKEIPEGWEVRYLGDKINIAYGKNLAKKNMKQKGYEVFSASGLVGYHDDFLYEEPQVLVVCRGSKSGKIFESNKKSFITNNCLVFESSISDILNRFYLKYFLLNSNISQFVTGSAQPQITIKNISKLNLLIPKKEVLNKFYKIIKSIDRKFRNNNNENKNLEDIRDTLLPKLMSGKIRVNKGD
ncbi:MAG: restriction endonuclease subunit S [Candidatus Mcinerneyibacterium aminivorans]|jgi:type I restriction enzyme S subunit|uniref:Restriction endonuclease subunit S n=1 Tax=Candidatus Mcinerneyibacterium aminivorans TaxID=2703815 RepID=A0A5D0M9U7_9BACT|nr:MAG: restriction endonuclease subunit S [Candidatus Mcinerneyibacterium aminivorans]